MRKHTSLFVFCILLATLFASSLVHARYYDPQEGRFISRDPLGYLQGDNMYEYTASDPLGRLDPTGQGWIKKVKSCCKVAKNAGKLAELLEKRKQIEKALKSFEKLIAEHEDKLRKYISDPDSYDNLGKLKDTTNRDKIIEGRIKSLEKQIEKQKGELAKKINEKDLLDSEIKSLNIDAKDVLGCIACPATQKLDNDMKNGKDVTTGQIAIGAGRDIIGIFDPGILDVYEWIFCGDK